MLAANIHALSHGKFSKTSVNPKLAHIQKKVYYWSIHGTVSQKFALSQNIWGLTALICFNMMFFFSTQYWRERAYNIFLRIHIVGVIFALLAVCSFSPHEEKYNPINGFTSRSSHTSTNPRYFPTPLPV